MRPSNRLLLILFLLFAGITNRAYAASDTAAIVQQAPAQMTAAQWKQLTSDKSLNYANEQEVDPDEANKKVAEDSLGWYQRLIQGFFNLLASGVGTVIVWIIVLSLIGYIVYRIFINSDSFLFRKNKKLIDTGDEIVENEHDITATNWEALLQQSVANKDMRLAIRYSYMRMLQLLQQRNMIQYRQDKTNYEYFHELQSAAVKPAFKQMTRLYEYAWYGRADLSVNTYNDYIALFNNTRKQLGA